jgi:hypothetical protein
MRNLPRLCDGSVMELGTNTVVAKPNCRNRNRLVLRSVGYYFAAERFSVSDVKSPVHSFSSFHGVCRPFGGRGANALHFGL